MKVRCEIPDSDFIKCTHFITLLIMQPCKQKGQLNWIIYFDPFFLPIRLNLRRGHQTGFGIQVQIGVS